MDLYLPIANLSVNALVIIVLGGVVGLLSGMFGVGGGFLTTPLLIFYGIPPTVAAASAASQVTGASVSGVVTHMERGTVDFRMGGVLIAGGVVGAGIGVLLFRLLQSVGQIVKSHELEATPDPVELAFEGAHADQHRGDRVGGAGVEILDHAVITHHQRHLLHSRAQRQQIVGPAPMYRGRHTCFDQSS